jgi:hypothetical protein
MDISWIICPAENSLACSASDIGHAKLQKNSAIPSGKLTKLWKITVFNGYCKSTISMAIFNSFLYVYQRVSYQSPAIAPCINAVYVGLSEGPMNHQYGSTTSIQF